MCRTPRAEGFSARIGDGHCLYVLELQPDLILQHNQLIFDADMNGNYDRNEPIVLFRTPEELEKVALSKVMLVTQLDP